jgi:hypothetical protein
LAASIITRPRQRHQVGRQEALVLALRVHVARVQEAVAFAVRAVQHEQVGAVGLGAEDLEVIAAADVVPAREHDVAVRADHRAAVVALVERDLRDVVAFGIHRVQVEHALALVFVERVVVVAQRLVDARLGLAVASTSSDSVELVRRRNVPPVSPPVVMSYSQMFQWPVQAGWPSDVFDVFDAGQRIEKISFLPSYDTSGPDASPLPCVNCAVMLCSTALADDFSRIIRSPPGAVGAPLVGFA